MLINFSFKNCRSFYDEACLSMQATSDTEYREINTFTVSPELMPKGENELLKAAIIFGGNASGKSNVLKALAYMKRMLLFSASQIPMAEHNETFAFLEEATLEESSYEVEIIQEGTFYKYGFTICCGKISSEWLYRRAERLTRVFSRNGDELEIVDVSKDAVKLINIAPGTLFLSVGHNFNVKVAPYLRDVLNWFNNVLIIFDNDANSFDIYTTENDKYKNMALKILKLADIGIKDMSVKKDKLATVSNIKDVLRLNAERQLDPRTMGQLIQENTDLYNIDMQTDFDVFDKSGKKVGEKGVLLFKNRGFNSEGTERLLFFLGWVLAALDQGRVILVDEIDSKLHFLVADYIVSLFNSISANPRNAQLIGTAHNILLMDENLRRDQIYFTGKDKYGKSSLIALSDYKNVRKTDLFSKKYLAGFYTDLPRLGKE